MPYPIVGTIGAKGLSGPNEYAFYLGSNQLTASKQTVGKVHAERIVHFGQSFHRDSLQEILLLLVLVGLVVLLLPIVSFIAMATRFGSENRDRRLATLRLIGADSRMVRRIAAGETGLGALCGVALGAALFVIARQCVEWVTISGFSVFTFDVFPSWALAIVIAISVPILAIMVTLLSLRRIIIEPLGVTRQS